MTVAIQMLSPALTLLVGGCLLFCASIFLGRPETYDIDNRRNLFGGLALLVLLVASAFHVWTQAPGGQWLPGSGLFAFDGLSTAAERLTLIGGFILLLMGWSIAPSYHLAEYYGCLLLILAGIPLAAASHDLIALFLSLELISIPTYILLNVVHGSNRSLEAALKYFLLSAFSSSLFLLGVSYLYGMSGSMDLTVVHQALVGQAFGRLGVLAVLLVLAGLAFRIAAVPFHFYAPDVFEGTTVLGAAMMSYLPKVAGFVAMLRVLDEPAVAEVLAPTLIPVLLLMAAITMSLGNAMASAQTSLRRLMGYSSIAHSGYLLLALAAWLLGGAGSEVLFTYLAAYAVMTLGVFACFAEIDEAGGRTLTVGDLSGMFYRRPAASIAMTICLLSLIGLPLTAGFVAKFQIFIAAGGLNRWDITLVTLLMAVNAVVAAGYYFRLLSKLFEKGVDLPPLRLWRPSLFLAYSVCVVLTIVWFFQPTSM
jgi:NADH-quinone oxidoreductase subunit N